MRTGSLPYGVGVGVSAAKTGLTKARLNIKIEAALVNLKDFIEIV
jgi:hypothetical protein